MIAIAVVLVAGAAWANATVIAAQDARIPVLVMARTVAWGQQITDNDLAVASAVLDPQAHMVPARDRASMVGKTALSRLAAGSVLAPEQLTDRAIPGPGQQVVGLLLKPGQFPARGVHAGDVVQVVPVIAGQMASGQSPASTNTVGFTARVVDVGTPDANGAVTVDIVVDSATVSAAMSAAAGQVLITLLGPGN